MDKKEFEEVVTPRVNNGCGGCVSPETWRVIEDVYMTTSLTKDQVADLFWNHTGRWSMIESAVKDLQEADRARTEKFAALQAAMNAARQSAYDAETSRKLLDGIVTDFRIDYAIRNKENN